MLKTTGVLGIIHTKRSSQAQAKVQVFEFCISQILRVVQTLRISDFFAAIARLKLRLFCGGKVLTVEESYVLPAF